MASLRTSLERLEKLTDRLNSETDQVNALIVGVEEKLTKLSLGVEVWLEADEKPVFLSNGSGSDTDSLQLGFQKLNGRWRLAVRTLLPTNTSEFIAIGSPRPLLETNRAIRVAACRQLNVLVDGISQQVESFLDDIEAAKGSVKP